MEPGSEAWLNQVVEDVLEPELGIVDPHHHLWPTGGALPYGIGELHHDVNAGHLVEQTVFIECHAAYDKDVSADRASVGETRFVATTAKADARAIISGIVAHTDLRADNLDEILELHTEASQGLLRGIRDALSRAEYPDVLMIPGRAVAGLADDPTFHAGVRRLGERGLTYDSWHYHYQNAEFLRLAQAVPETTMILDHFGTPLGVGPYASQRSEIFQAWKQSITELAKCSNVVAKLGGLAMPDNGFGWNSANRPPTSDEFLAAQAPYYLHTIEAFGPERCMFESNFPIDRFSLSYNVYWNACKKLTASYTATEREAMFSGTARRVYRLSK